MRINVVIINPVFLAAFFGTGTACAFVIVASLLRFPGGGYAYLHVGGILYLVGSFLVTVVALEPMELNQDGLCEPGICPVNHSTIQTLKSAVVDSSKPN